MECFEGGWEAVGSGAEEEVDLDADPLLGECLAAVRLVGNNQPVRSESPVNPQPNHGQQQQQQLLREGEGELQGRLRQLWQRAQMLGTPEGVDNTPDEQFLTELGKLLPDPDAFLAGGWGRRAELWEEWFRLAAADQGTGHAKGLSREQKWLVTSLRHGLRLEWVPADHPAQASAPNRAKKLEIVRSMLRAALRHSSAGEAAVDSKLGGSMPAAVYFPNHRSASEQSEFVTSELQKALAMGAVQRWDPAWGQPTVVNPIRVVVSEDGAKKRLCINPMYINLFLRYRPVKYERLQDMPALLRPGDYLYTTDDKSGYWQLPLHPSAYTFLAMEWDGELYYWAHLPFGLAPACQIYTLAKRELYQPLRDLGVRMTYLIDDQAGAASGLAAAKFQCRLVVELLCLLGTTLSPKKCVLLPRQCVRFLGLEVDAGRRVFRVPEDKVGALQSLVGRAKQAAALGTLTFRDLARVVGKIFSLSLAVSLAPLHARLVALALTGKVDWAAAVPDPEEAVAAAEAFLRILGASNGRATWDKEGAALQLALVGDASDRAYGVFLPQAELGRDRSQFTQPFSPEELARMAAGQFSSTERELGALLAGLKWLAEQAPHLLANRRVQYQTDSQAAAFCVVGQKGGRHCLRKVEAICLLAAARGCEVGAVWYPREGELQVRADALSKWEDGSQWKLHPDVYSALLRKAPPGFGGRRRIDAFADSWSRQEPAFFSCTWCEGTAGVDAFAQCWRPEAGTAGPYLYLYPPYEGIGRVLRKIQLEMPDCVLVLPRWRRWWSVLLRELPVCARWVLPRHPQLLLAGPMLPNSGCREAHCPDYQLEAFWVQWRGKWEAWAPYRL